MNGISELFQSGLEAVHGTESALLKVSIDLLMLTYSRKCIVLVLSHLSAAFDTVDFSFLISHLEHCVDINFASCGTPLQHGIPQGSILGPLLFYFYLLPLGSAIRKHGASFNFLLMIVRSNHWFKMFTQSSSSEKFLLTALKSKSEIYFYQDLIWRN